MSQAREVRVILTDSLVGLGEKDQPFRRVAELWSLDGRLLAAWDSFTREGTATADVFAPEPPGDAAGVGG